MPKRRTKEVLPDIRIDIHLSQRHKITGHRYTSPDEPLLVERGSSNTAQDMLRTEYLIKEALLETVWQQQD